METRARLSVLFSLAVCFTGCSQARYVLREPDRGIVAIPSSSQSNREKAHELMAQHFPEGYVIEREHEQVVGETTTLHQHNEKLASASTRDRTEWRIYYSRK